MGSTSQLGVIALAMAGGAMVMAAVGLMRSPAPATACDCDTETLHRKIAALEQRVDAAERTAVRRQLGRVSEAAAVPTTPLSPTETTRDAEPPELPHATPTEPAQFVELRARQPGLSVGQNDDGSLAVTNTNPELTVGATVMIEARDDSGTVREVPVTIPPP